MTPEVIEDFQACVEFIGGYLTEKKSRSKAREFHVNGIWKIRKEWGLYGTAKEKRVPDRFYSLPIHQIYQFLNAFWSCDGCVRNRNLEVTLANEGLIDDLRFMLLRCGVLARKRGRGTSFHYRGEKKFSYAWVLNIQDRPNCRRFLDLVGTVRG